MQNGESKHRSRRRLARVWGVSVRVQGDHDRPKSNFGSRCVFFFFLRVCKRDVTGFAVACELFCVLREFQCMQPSRILERCLRFCPVFCRSCCCDTYVTFCHALEHRRCSQYNSVLRPLVMFFNAHLNFLGDIDYRLRSRHRAPNSTRGTPPPSPPAQKKRSRQTTAFPSSCTTNPLSPPPPVMTSSSF